MVVSDSVAGRTDHIAELIEQRLGVRGRGLEAKLKRARRRLPRWVRQQAQQLVEAERLMDHPKLMKQADTAALDTAYRQVESWLETVDRSKRRKDRFLNWLALNVLTLMLVGAVFVAWLVWAGKV